MAFKPSGGTQIGVRPCKETDNLSPENDLINVYVMDESTYLLSG